MPRRISENPLVLILGAVVLISSAVAQVAVSPSPEVHPQFLDNSGNPLAGGKVFTYAAGTLTPLATYIDATGVIANPNPIPLDASGSPSNGSVQTGIWLSNNAYRFCVYDLNLVQQYCVDNIVGYLNILNLGNIWTFPQTFAVPVTISALNNQIVFGSVGSQTTLDFPIPVGNITVHGPSASTTLVGRDTVDTLTNKTSVAEQLTSPVINGTTVVDSPGTYITLQNESAVGTALITLTKIANTAGQARIAAPSDTGIIGITVLNPGTTGTVTIQESGTTFCQFDGSVTGGDYVTVSSTNAGFCHDAGATYPANGQAIGRVISSAGSGPQVMMLFGPELRGAQVSPAITSSVAGAAAGTSPTITCTNCFDNGGRLSVTTGSAPSTSATIVTVTFAGTYTAANCTISPSGANAAALATTSAISIVTGTGPPATLVLSSGSVALAGTTQYVWYYTCNFR